MYKKKILILLLILVPLLSYLGVTIANAQNTFASGAITISFNNSPISGPIFSVENMLPGDCVEKNITIQNSTNSQKEIKIKSENITQSGNLATVLNFEIKKNNSTIIYSTNNLNNFFNLTSTTLTNIPTNTIESFTFKICFDPNADNSYQNKFTKFDLIFITDGNNQTSIPAQCLEKGRKIENIIIGTEKNDNIRGTSKKDYINGFSGDDKITGTSDDDCIWGGEGNDELDGGSGEDYIWGEEGNDIIDGRSGNDIIYSGNGDDTIDAGAGEDNVWSENGNDSIKAGPGNDKVDSGDDSDSINGNTGKDKCTNGETITNCEE